MDDPDQQKALGQFFTPARIAQLMVSMARSGKDRFVLEPSSGAGIFLDALASADFTHVVGQEIDASVVDDRHASRVRVGSFVGAEFAHDPHLVIGNPPYVRWKNMTESQRAELAADPLWREHFNSLCDLLFYFIARSVQLLEPGGEMILITPDFWLATKHASALRSYLLVHGQLTDMVRFGEARVFPGVASSISIFRYEKRPSSHTQPVRIYDWIGSRDVQLPHGLAADILDDPALFAQFSAPHPLSAEPGWTFLDADERAVAEHLEKACHGHTLGEMVQIANGMVSGLDKAFRLDADLYASMPPAERLLTIPVLKAKDIQAMHAGDPTRYIFAESVIDESAFAAHEILHARLAPHKAKLQERYDYGRSLAWWHWAFLRSRSLFDDHQPSVMIPCKERITNKDRLRACVAPAGVYPTQDVTAMRPLEGVGESPHYISALLSSRQWFAWVSSKGLLKGGVAEFSERPLAAIPMRRINFADTNDVSLHDAIVEAARADDPNLKLIDDLVERLVGQ